MYATMSRPVPWAKTTDSAPYFSFMSMNFSVMRSYASSQVMRSHLSLPRSLGSRFMGYSRRSLWFVTSGTSKQRMHRRPSARSSAAGRRAARWSRSAPGSPTAKPRCSCCSPRARHRAHPEQAEHLRPHGEDPHLQHLPQDGHRLARGAPRRRRERAGGRRALSGDPAGFAGLAASWHASGARWTGACGARIAVRLLFRRAHPHLPHPESNSTTKECLPVYFQHVVEYTS